MASKAVNKYSRRERQTADGDKKARAAQRAIQGRHLHGYQGCRQVQQERTVDGRTAGRLKRQMRMATRRLVLCRELLKDAKRAGHR